MKNYLRRLMPLVLAFMMVLSAGFDAQTAFGVSGNEEAVSVEDADAETGIVDADPVASDVMLADGSGLAESYEDKTVILSTNDVHGAIGKTADFIGGYQYAAGLKKELEKRGADVVLVDCGDFSQGDIYVDEYKGESAIELMNSSGYDYATLGNHEFDFGIENLHRNIGKAEFRVLCADILYDDTNESVYQEKDLYREDDNNLVIGFFGMDTPEAQTKSMPSNFIGLHCPKNQDFYATAQKQVDSLKAEKADLVFCIAHLGIDAESAPYRSTDLYANTAGIDMILDGHSHTVMTEGPNKEPIMSTGTKFANIGVTVVDEKTKKIEDHYLYKVTEECPSDETVRDIADNFIADIEQRYSTKIGESRVFLNGERGDLTTPGNRNSETNLGDLAADAIKWYVTEKGVDLGVDAKNVVSIQNGGGIRASINIGDVTRKDVFRAFPYRNSIMAVTVTGNELLEALEASTFCSPAEAGGFPQVSGIEFKVNTFYEYDRLGDTYPSSTYYGPGSIRRVKISNINGNPFDPEADYVVLTNTFVADGGDTYHAFRAASSKFDTGISCEYAVRDFIEKHLGIIEAPYDQPQGRITVITEADPDTVAEMINDLPEQISKEDQYAVDAARRAFEDLTEEEKARLTAGTEDRLKAAEAKLEAAAANDKADEANAKADAAEKEAAAANSKAENAEKKAAAAAERATAAVALANNVIKALSVDRSKYRKEGVRKLAAAIDAARAVLKRSGASAKEMTKASSDINSAMKGLRKKSANPMKVSARRKSVRASGLKKKKKSVKAIGVSGAKGKVTYRKAGGSRRLTVNKKTGKITVKKRTGKGKYKIKVRVTAAGNGEYKAASKVIRVTVRVR